MGESGELQAREAVPDALPGLADVLGRVALQFDSEGALGVIAIDAAELFRVEHSFGAQAHRDALRNLRELVRAAIEDRLGIGDLIVAGEIGRSEIVVLIFRSTGEVRFHSQELPELARVIGEAIARRGGRICWPHLRSTPPLHVGTGAALRNPTIGTDTQLRQALAEAREHAELTARVEARRRKRRRVELLLERKVRSVYEPIVDAATHTVFGYEALARGPEGTDLYSPMALFRDAAEADLTFQLDCLCRRSGLAGARDLPGGAKLFLNIRPTSIHDPAFKAEAITRTLEESQLAPTDVVFEISEQESIQNYAIFREVRDYYRALGIQIALDDVGAGYASLEAVLEVEPEFIKVDRAFVSGIDEDESRQELLRALRGVADRIGARIIGEGLDTLEELVTLRELGISFGQGWLFGKPTPLRHDL